MIKILADATLPELPKLFPKPYTLTTYQTQDQVLALLPEHDVLLCRSTLKVTEQLLAGSNIQCVATASSGVDHIDSDYLKKHNIMLFDAKGCNARAVADYVVSTLAVLQNRNVLTGNKAGVIGVGEVGSRVVTRLIAAGFEVICFDPLKSSKDSKHHYGSLADLTSCDLLCIHANWHDIPPFPSHHLLNAEFLKQLKPGTTIINASRGGIVDEDALLKVRQPISYCTDVYSNEPFIDARIVDFSTICTPHIAGHSIEAKQAAVMLLSQKLHHHHGLPAPTTHSLIKESSTIVLNHSNWQDCVLKLYNPLTDTEQLKSATDKAQAFITLRQAHIFRHDYTIYNSDHLDKLIQELLGG